jgi:hypothetical protein
VASFGEKNRETAIAIRLANGDTIAETAALCGVSQRTVSRLKAEPKFAMFVLQLRAELRGNACGRIASHNRTAVDRLAGLLDSDNEQIVLGAARAILEHAPKLTKECDTEQRLAAIEQHQRDQGREV